MLDAGLQRAYEGHGSDAEEQHRLYEALGKAAVTCFSAGELPLDKASEPVELPVYVYELSYYSAYHYEYHGLERLLYPKGALYAEKYHEYGKQLEHALRYPAHLFAPQDAAYDSA